MKVSLSARLRPLAFGLCFLVGAVGLGTAAQAGEAQNLVDKARLTVAAFSNDPDMGDMRTLMREARGVMIIPQVLKAGFFIGGEGGTGVLLSRDDGGWSAPAFYTMGAGSIGLQFGAQASEVVLIFMNERAVDAVLHNRVKLGADASVAAGPVGTGIEAATTTNFRDDIYSYSRSKGLFAGASVEGAVIEPRESLNQEYYGRAVTPEEIVLKRSVDNPGADELQAVLSALVGGRS